VLSGGKDYQMVWMLIYNTDFLDALTGGDVSGHHRNPTTTTTTTVHVHRTNIPAWFRTLYNSTRHQTSVSRSNNLHPITTAICIDSARIDH
jgi:hypothetical protein